MFYIQSFFKLGDAVRICDPDSQLCGLQGNIDRIEGFNGVAFRYGVVIYKDKVSVDVSCDQVEPN